ncbi:glycosyltransferase family 39 protein [Desulfogranum japonicum]|uniref:glycosyltransferase family 39 protein n=1 Tax=Desulfogranum japonicum TaxID=231447 RepID=UPI000423CFA5|nr:glycosyltransferase family 39 protein [Desulfogranum japonicum]
MDNSNIKSPLYTSLCIIIGFTLLRALLSTQFLLAPDETNYWQWSRYLDLGYHDHPPMIAWTIWLSTKLFGHTAFGVRLPTLIGGAIFSIYTTRLTGQLAGWRLAPAAALLTQVVLLYNGSALIATPDGLLLPCWAAACYHAAMALTLRNKSHWIATGIWFGLGMLSKYTMLLFLPSLFFYMICTPRFRKELATAWPWAGLFLGLVLFSPVLIWNWQHEWATFRHVLYQGGLDDGPFFTLRFVGDFFASQAALLSPFLFLFILILWFYPPMSKNLGKEARAYLCWMSLPGFLIFLLLAFHVRIYGNWPAPVFTTAIILFLAVFAPPHKKPQSKWPWRLSLYGGICITLPILLQVTYPLLPIPLNLDRTARETTGWDQLGAIVYKERETMKRPESTFIFGLRYQYASELAFYTPGNPQTVSINRWSRPNVYDFWWNDSMLQGQDAIGVFSYRPMEQQLAGLFQRIDPVKEINLTRNSPWFGLQNTQKLYLFKGYGFKGGIRWIPENKNDIRATRYQTTEQKQ